MQKTKQKQLKATEKKNINNTKQSSRALGVANSKYRVTKPKDKVTKSKLKWVLGGKIEAQAGLGFAKPKVKHASGLRGRSWVGQE